MTCGDADCKQEDVKDVKINPKYLHCEQYPSCDRWYRPDRVGYVAEAMPKKSYGGILTTDGIDVSRDPRLLGDPGTGRGRYSPGRQPCHQQPPWPIPVFNQDRTMHGRLDQSLEKERVSQVDGRRYHPASIISRPEVNEKSPVVPVVCDPSVRACQPEFCLPRSLLEVHGRLDPLELRLRTDYRLQGPSYGQGKFAEDEAERVISNEALEGERGREEAQSRASLQYTGRTRSYEKPDYGEDLSCGESCCRWRTPRRHVANRVTASPWRQIIRPHHLPKIQPMILQTHADETEVTENARVPETTQPASLSGSPLLHQSPKNPSTTDFYGFEVPTNREFAFNDPGPIPPAEKLPEPTCYAPRVPYPTSQPAPALPPVVRTAEAHFRPANETPSGMIPTSVDSGQPPAKKSSYFGQNPKPELSHPVSRLCDTIDSGEGRDKRETVPVVEQKKPEEGKEESTVGRIVVNGDSNNNDAIVSGENAQRGRPNGAQEDHRCEQCGKTFVTRASLKVHSRTHSGEKPFRCADCGKQFSQLRNYKYHRSVHEGTREFAATCPECGKYFNDRGYLSSHMKIHRNRKEYGCAECGKSFNQRVAYNMHVRIHTGVKPHQCEQCGKAFSRKMLLKQHLRTHSGERPYQCQVCQKAFADRSNMTLHTRLHSGLKPYQCTLCSKAFTKKHHLKTHLNYHTGTKPYSCPNCGLRFSQSSNMRTHFKKCAVNNPAGVKNPQADPSPVDAAKTTDVQVIHRAPTDALTPPNSDQESSILTPISKTVTEPN